MAPHRQAAAVGLAIALAIGAWTASLAQSSATCNCPPPKLVPITGRVLDSETGKPIAGAVVHYFDSNPPVDGKTLAPVRKPIVGEVKSATDGSYVLPADLPSSTFHVRASAPGHFSADFYDWPAIVGHKWPANFPPRPSHDLRLEPSHDLVALGSSLFGGAKQNVDPALAATFSNDGRSLMLAGDGPALWVVSLPEGHITPVALPKELVASKSMITQIGWDGTHLIFMTNDAQTRWVGTASVPDLHVTVAPAPNNDTEITISSAQLVGSRYTVEEISACDSDSSPHCGQGGSIVARDGENGRTIPIKTGSVDDLSYLLQPSIGTIIFADNQVSHVPQRAGLTMLDLKNGQRSHIKLPGNEDWPRLTLLTEVIVPGGMRVAYSKEGDCDPASTDAAQPSSPSGIAGYTPDSWSVCVVTIPWPSASAPTASASKNARISAEMKGKRSSRLSGPSCFCPALPIFLRRYFCPRVLWPGFL